MRTRITGTGSTGDLEQTRLFAQSILAMMPDAAYIDIHTYDQKTWTYVQTAIDTVYTDGVTPEMCIQPTQESTEDASPVEDLSESAEAPTPAPPKRRKSKKTIQVEQPAEA